MDLVIGNKNYSSWSLRPWLLMRHHGMSFDEIHASLLGTLNGVGLRERLSQYSDSCRVPVLMDGETTVWDSLAICEYLSETYLNGLGWPRDKNSRAVARSLCAEMHSGFTAVRAEMPMNCRAVRKVSVSKAAQMDIDRMDAIWSDYSAVTPAGDRYLFSEFSIADCFFAPVALRFRTYQIPLSAKADAYAKCLLNHPSLCDWVSQAKNETESVEDDEAGIDSQTP